LNKFSPLPLKNEPLLRKILPLKVEPLASETTTNPSSASTDAVTEPVANNLASPAIAAFILSCASCESAENGISIQAQG